MISLASNTIIHKYRFKRAVCSVKFSPNGKHFAVCKENNGKIFAKINILTGFNVNLMCCSIYLQNSWSIFWGI